jgi:anthranilate synthase component 2
LILLIDNHDSFTWNLADILRRRKEIRVVLNDEITVEEIAELKPQGILISPGPGRPAESGISPAVVRHFAGKIPLLGVCLGHQLIGELYGAKVVHGRVPFHGKTTDIQHSGKNIFLGLPQPLTVMRYHSLVLGNDGLPQDLEITAWTASGEVMGIRHKILPLEGVQFHPESILTKEGEHILFNWMGSLSE